MLHGRLLVQVGSILEILKVEVLNSSFSCNQVLSHVLGGPKVNIANVELQTDLFLRCNYSPEPFVGFKKLDALDQLPFLERDTFLHGLGVDQEVVILQRVDLALRVVALH